MRRSPQDAVLANADVIFSPDEVAVGFDNLATDLQPLIEASDCILLGILNGGMFALVHLAERLAGDFRVDYCHATRYEGGMEGQSLTWLEQPHVDLAGMTVIVVDDIFDEGTTLRAVADYCSGQGAARVYTAVLIVKDRARPAATPLPDFTAGLQVPDRYVFGCGMDMHGRWRHLRGVYALEG